MTTKPSDTEAPKRTRREKSPDEVLVNLLREALDWSPEDKKRAKAMLDAAWGAL